MPKPRPATAQKERPTSKRRVSLFLSPSHATAGRDSDEAEDGTGPVHVRAGGGASTAVSKIRELEAENACLMRENHDLHRMLSDTTAS
jgi:hypothetical protein